MERWQSLIPASRPAASQVDDVELGDEIGAERQRLVALRWHLAAIAGRHRWSGPDEIHRLTAEPLPWQPDDLPWSLRSTYQGGGWNDDAAFRLPAIIARQIPVGWLAASAPALTRIHTDLAEEVPFGWYQRVSAGRSRPALIESYRAALDRLRGGMPAGLLGTADRFGVTALGSLGDRRADPAVVEALTFAATLGKPVPSQAWSRRAGALLARPASEDSSSAVVLEALRVLSAAFVETTGQVHDDHDQLLRGVCWLLATDPSTPVSELLARVATAAGEPIGRSSAPRAVRTTAAAAEILAGRPGPAAARALVRLSLTVRNKALRTRVLAALDRMGTTRGWAPGEAGEMAVDDHGLAAADAPVEIIGDKATARRTRGRPVPPPVRSLAKEVNKTLAGGSPRRSARCRCGC
ncbi:hypothetical protein [Actinoplanes sp. G11-F43]|uniref:hypothetical protein n=1 Tax=Actinoplanes sp. G11-F43 TaxID=3424130 RepID=UPI003D325438